MTTYKGRFAPSPTGPLHLGSLVAALASWLDARAYGLVHGYHQQQWIVRIEDTDQHRCKADAGHEILRQLAAFGLISDEPVQWQSQRWDLYAQALNTLKQQTMAYPCQCTRGQIEAAWQSSGHAKDRFATLVYPGTCRNAAHVDPVRSWRFRTDKAQNQQSQPLTQWLDRRLGPQQQDVPREVGDFVLLRADGMWSYQLACVVDDAQQGITHVVRGEDLLDNTARQIQLQAALALPPLQYLHIPLALDERGEKLSKGNGAMAIDTHEPMVELNKAAAILQLQPVEPSCEPTQAFASWTQQWRMRFFP